MSKLPPSLLSPEAPMSSGATTRKGMDSAAKFGEAADKKFARKATGAGPASGKGVSGSRGNGRGVEDGTGHLEGAVRSLAADRRRRPDRAPNGEMIKC